MAENEDSLDSSFNWLDSSIEIDSNTILKLPAGIRLLAGIRSDLQRLDTDQLSDRIVIRNWWESGGFRDYPHLDWPLSSAEIDALRQRPADDPLAVGGNGLSVALKGSWPSILDLLPAFAEYQRTFVIGPDALLSSLPPPMMFVWRDRPDLQSTHDVESALGRLSFLKWWFLFGHSEYVRLRWMVAKEWLEVPPLRDNENVPLPTFLWHIITTRDDLNQLFPIHTEAGRLAGLHWWEHDGCLEYGVPGWALTWHTPLRRMLAHRAISFNSADLDVKIRPAVRLPYLPFIVRQMRADLVAAFNTENRTGCEQLLSWWQANGQIEYDALTGLIQDPDPQTPGLNIVGYAQSVIGIAEDVRMAARSAELASVPFCVIDAPMPGPQKSEHSLDSNLVEIPKHPVSLYCLPPSEIFRLGMESRRRLLSSGTYNIGGFHWELPQWPNELACVTAAVDEIWVYTDFVRNAFSPLTTKPVLKMPLGVELPKHAGRDRSAFGLPKEPFLFLLMFDGNSWLSRKNPIAAVRAFQKAFTGNRHVGLVIKAISLNRESDGWREVESEICNDSRVKVIDQTLNRSKLTQLMATCDAYVSLHRSEGFGRIIAEAMLLGIPTVTTNFSGSTEFCTCETSYLVNGPLVNLKRGDYLFPEGQHWCDPDIEEAVFQMQRLFEDKRQTDNLVSAARDNIQNNFSPKTAGNAYKSRLITLRASGQI